MADSNVITQVLAKIKSLLPDLSTSTVGKDLAHVIEAITSFCVTDQNMTIPADVLKILQVIETVLQNGYSYALSIGQRDLAKGMIVSLNNVALGKVSLVKASPPPAEAPADAEPEEVSEAPKRRKTFKFGLGKLKKLLKGKQKEEAPKEATQETK